MHSGGSKQLLLLSKPYKDFCVVQLIPYKTPQPSPGVFCAEGDLGLSLFFDKLEDNQQHDCAKEGGQQASEVKASQHIGVAAH